MQIKMGGGEMYDKYELRLYDDTLVSFSLTVGALGGYEASISHIEDEVIYYIGIEQFLLD